ncbi:undecaprenyldiphospho-muramoylpentapeptide beta-N-acetylglucosaminyltransferase [Frankia nepalensis]|uniref:UDP-N-acetylglucosamine--N-acetylmuramyl-(pentapeptide) pyrophosphoryl-undecaprenol N-acetylglucosamine transferase n=1 Tax=Frankia nepalensis TaxID=1836974 RepID=A0A937REL6_9ACTN|nr:undecaprenyldiphospho-muramoylpentapeptide beta-N-acetylglucosaminyltransferase [Frankia nepalensis]MBL7500362.1 undecaprenyldiphospho-muramoylpentapeptide beta-N-acetylglucosaminyltransferase [Frankia nepalensis]MBL7508660.1 undecaprenyldiphospho-muramoylpentapeptide beta-N-acetylglucosaminyltransferase [Frankia nepalensis]MBL7628822.1 undecaprenyldiphospho-muramoylpentapeptide beta-N-acetylglucosaminyltransferase [Frankia nepalensis]
MLKSVLLAGGGTAGHVEPALAVADALRAAEPRVRLTMLGTATGLEARLVPARGYELATIPKVPLPRRPTPALLTVPGRLAGAVNAAADAIVQARADVVVGFGAYVAVAAYLAARRKGVPIVVHEANPLPGFANRLGSRFTSYVATSYPSTPLRGARLTGIPLRAEILTLDRSPAAARAARQRYGLDPHRPTLLVFGGSQGARSLNTTMTRAAHALTRSGVQVLHATGPKNIDDVMADLPAGLPAPYQVLPYLDHIPSAYAAADMVLCRSGAMTCAELAAVGLPAAYVPLPHGNGEQRRNALPTVEAGGGLLVEDANLSADWIMAEVLPVLATPERLAKMSAACAGTGHPGAAQAIVAMIREAEASRKRSGGRHAAH